MNKPIQIDQYEKNSFTAPVRGGHQVTHDVYSRGSGKLLVLIQELPGIGQETLALADRFVARGYKVFLPHLFGAIGTTNMPANFVRVMCMQKEFNLFASGRSSPVVDWLKALCQKVKEEHGAKGVATIGMCLTGNFAIALMADEAVLASFASQPAVPLVLQRRLQLSEEEIAVIKERLDRLGPMHCGRFAGDILCRNSKMKALDRTFNTDDKKRIILHTLPGMGHSILTLDFVDEAGHPTARALAEVMDYFDESLAE
ncbi:dienelactone hydrolase family protein [Flavilitoribacter nigricans]|uniref:Dienelactone hydrolase n=1 Tax=Flavilitoribacter nigricans (strain ATCC 23147 / DSM 23189 / NBRC 102662 / NCIMB 1420 / SS-2) TaxID=1122177 RepID=A0A2D0MZL8_FLAN2|nr:dienelactone hydrolase family protein [Flavilitoribacter nigricans]PHN01721.1 dienelactone hydrolase [Flavilitoribacter nigricans DSM 23189 = NBRC 102662]